MLELLLLFILGILLTGCLILSYMCLDTRITCLERQIEIFENILKDKLY